LIFKQKLIDKLLGNDDHAGETPATTSPSGRTAYPNKAYPGTWDLLNEDGTPYAPDVSEERKNSYMSADVGGSITSSGVLVGHSGENARMSSVAVESVSRPIGQRRT
jgi:hypothetical protein